MGLFSNPGEKVLILVKSRRQTCPIVFLLLKTFFSGLENNDTLKYWSNKNLTTLTYVVKLENYQRNISILWLFFKPGQKNSIFFVHSLKPGSLSATYKFGWICLNGLLAKKIVVILYQHLWHWKANLKILFSFSSTGSFFM